MRKIKSEKIKQAVERLFLKANTELRTDVLRLIKQAADKEQEKLRKQALKILVDNSRIAKRKKIPLCQDTGYPVVFVEYGQEVVLKGDGLERAVNEGVKKAYSKNKFRNSVVKDPLKRKPPFTRSPALIHAEIKRGSKIKLSVMPKGFGSENKNSLMMLSPTAGKSEIIEAVKEIVKAAGADACPPYFLGIGIGGTSEHALLMAKKALLKSFSRGSTDKGLAALAAGIKKEINKLNIGPMGLGGKFTCLGVNIITHPTHIAGLPVAVNLGCHSLRSASEVI